MSIDDDVSDFVRMASDSGMVCILKKFNCRHSLACGRFSTFISKTRRKNDFKSTLTLPGSLRTKDRQTDKWKVLRKKPIKRKEEDYKAEKGFEMAGKKLFIRKFVYL